MSYTDSESVCQRTVSDDPDIEASLNAELGIGINENHFSQPEGWFGLTSEEELQLAINRCKDLILETPEKSERRSLLVKKLVQLRLRLQELQDGVVLPPETKLVLGHQMEKQSSIRTGHLYCEHCCHLIWGLVSHWYRCSRCGYHCHAKCVNLIRRTCAASKVEEKPEFMLQICPEKGLSAQGYRCAECRVIISHAEHRLCDYCGLYYCTSCNWNNREVIPARVMHNWDFEPRPVCRASKQFLKLMEKKPVLCIPDINPMLFCFIEELNMVKQMREKLLVMKGYLVACKTAMKSHLLQLLQPRQHFVENFDMYSMQDLNDVVNGTLVEWLESVCGKFQSHIMQECEGCHGRGHICGLCCVGDILFPFQENTSVCPECSAVFHRDCYMKRKGFCNRCSRRAERAKDEGG